MSLSMLLHGTLHVQSLVTNFSCIFCLKVHFLTYMYVVNRVSLSESYIYDHNNISCTSLLPDEATHVLAIARMCSRGHVFAGYTPIILSAARV